MTGSTKVVGGGSSAVAASTHAACARFRGTDPLITGRTRRKLAQDVGYADDFGGIPEARWLRAATFERLVRDKSFASEVATTAVGSLKLERPSSVVIANAHVSTERTAEILAAAHERAVSEGAATMIYQAAVPFVGFEDASATPVLPDFAVVARKAAEELDDGEADGSWLIVGDAKDYERVRSKIDDGRLLKGFLQVALGAESAAEWSQLPAGMDVHRYGVLAVPRNAFLQPEALVDDLDDHRTEVRMRVAERRREAEGLTLEESDDIARFVEHLEATFNPATCVTCTLFAYCRDQLRRSENPTDVLIELGIDPDMRPHVVGLIDGTGEIGPASQSVQALITATLDGIAQPTGQLRTDPVGEPGTLNVVLAKSDSSALGVLGMSVQRISSAGPGPWVQEVFDNPVHPDTRRTIMKILGQELADAIADQRALNPDSPAPVHLVVPEKTTADILASIADNVAGIELSRLRWMRDKEMGRPQLTINGDPADVPPALKEMARTAVSFLLDDDRSRTLQMRSPIVNVQAVLSELLVPGGPSPNALRLDYLTVWARATSDKPLDHRAITDEVEASIHTPGARLTNRRSDAIHRAYMGEGDVASRPAQPAEYERLILDELDFKQRVIDDAVAVLGTYPVSRLAELYSRAEANAQAVWYRRLKFHASDLVRFGRTNRPWRRDLVPVVEGDDKVAQQMAVIGNPQVALDAALDAGNGRVALAEVVGVDPLVLDVRSRKIGHESRVVLLHVNGQPCVEADGVAVDKHTKISGLSIGPLSSDGHDVLRRYEWKPANDPELEVGDVVVIADFTWFRKLGRNTHLGIDLPKVDENRAPKPSCSVGDFGSDPTNHLWCCRPHEDIEAESSDWIAERRNNGELNPQVWPPVVDQDAFEVSPKGAPKSDPAVDPPEPVPGDVIMDDLE